MSELTTSRTANEQTRAIEMVTREVHRCCEAYARMKHSESVIDAAHAEASDSAIVATLTYARSLIEFFLDENRRDDDIQLSNFPGSWSVNEWQLSQRLRADKVVINKHLAHLTWSRLSDTDEWDFDDLPRTLESLATSWLTSIPTSEGLATGNGRAFLMWARSALDSAPAVRPNVVP